MPELPEVTITSSQLNTLFRGWMVTGVTIFGNTKVLDLSHLNSLPQQILYITNKGKNIIFWLSGNVSILSHMMLAGHWSIIDNGNNKYITLHMTNDNQTTSVHYYDNMGIGWFYLTSADVVNNMIKLIKPSIFDNIAKEQYLLDCRRKNKSKMCIYKIIMDQKMVLSGVGNYVANEALYLSNISPLRTMFSLTDQELLSLYNSIYTVCINSYSLGGVSERDYLDAYDRHGTYQHNFNVFRCTADPYGNAITKITISGRSVYWCKSKQI